MTPPAPTDKFHISRPLRPPQISHFTPPAAPQVSHFTPPAAPQISHFTPPAAPQISHFTPPAAPQDFTFHAPCAPPRFHISRPLCPPRPDFTFHAPTFSRPLRPPQVSHFTPAAPSGFHISRPLRPPRFHISRPHISRPLRPPKFHISRPLRPPPTFHISRPLRPVCSGFRAPNSALSHGFARFGRPSSLNPRPCLRAKRWRTKIRAAHEHLRRAQREGSGGLGKGRDAAFLDREAARNRSTQKPFTPPLLEDVEEAEDHDVHLVAGEGPGVPGRGWGAGHSRVTAGRGGRADSTQGTSEHKRTKPHCLGAHKPAKPQPLPTLKPLWRPTRSDDVEEEPERRETLELQEGGFTGGRQRRALLTSDLRCLRAPCLPTSTPNPEPLWRPASRPPGVRAVCVFAAFLTLCLSAVSVRLERCIVGHEKACRCLLLY